MDRARDIRIKFCGLTRLEDAIAAVHAGADMLGFNFYDQSPRYLAPDDCTRLIAGLRREMGQLVDRVNMVGVFVNTSPKEISEMIERCGLDLAQLSGDEDPVVLRRLGERAFKAIRSDARWSLAQIGSAYPRRGTPPALLVDAVSPGLYGGSGHVADWDQAEALARRAPILLAGGLTPSNVAAAIRVVRPWGVDVASGIEPSPGVKDRAKMVDFVQAVRDQQERSQ